jgi:hypothetical protein
MLVWKPQYKRQRGARQTSLKLGAWRSIEPLAACKQRLDLARIAALDCLGELEAPRHWPLT